MYSDDFVMGQTMPSEVAVDRERHVVVETARPNDANARDKASVRTLDEKSRVALSEADKKLQEVQLREKTQTFTATVFASAVSSAMRREYLSEWKNLSLKENYGEEMPKGDIKWLRLVEVGVQDDFSPAKAAESLECVFSAFHLPDRARLLFLVSSDTTDGGGVTVHLGLQSIAERSHQLDNMAEVITGFSQSVWPGLSFVESTKVDLRFKNAPKMPGVRVITGIPAVRADDKVDATIDKLAAALRGKSWRYLVIADPIPSNEIDAAIHACNELAGKAESLKSFQISESIAKAVTDSWAHTDGMTNTTSQRQMGAGQKLSVAAIVGVGAAAAGCAVLAGLNPALLPAFLAVAQKSVLVGMGAKLAASGIMMPLSLAGGAILAGAKTKSEAESASDALTKSVTSTESGSFSRTLVNKHAEATVKLIESQIKRFQLCSGIGSWQVGAYLIGEDDATADIGANVIKSLISGDDSYQEPVRIFDPYYLCRPAGRSDPLYAISKFANPNISSDCDVGKITHPLGARFEKLQTVVNTRELTRFANFPLSNVPGVPVRRIAADMGLRNPVAADDKPKIVLGNQMYRGQVLDKHPYAFDKDLLAKHALVCGINGSGKTTTILGILGHLLSSTAPFLVIEPAKQEYVDWAVSQNAELIKKYEKKLTSEKAKKAAKADPRWIGIYIPGREKWNREDLDQLSLNPFDFVWLNSEEKPKILEHIDRLKTIINAALPMQEVLPILMEELIYSVYGTKNSPVDGKYICWLPRDASSRTPKFDENIPVPSFVEMANHIPELFKRIKYGNEVQHNLRAALTTRVDSFKRGWKRPLLNKQLPRHKVGEWDKLFKHPTVINLTSLASDDDKAFFMAIILMFIYEYRQEESEMMANNQSGEKPQGLKHLLVIEEAHRILGRCEGAASVFSAAPKQKASELFSNMISEVRAYGQGILIADQIPGRLNEDAVKNTNLKIVHRLVASDDRQAMATSLNLWNDQERIIGDLHVGEALVRGDMDNEAYMVKIKKIEPHKS